MIDAKLMEVKDQAIDPKSPNSIESAIKSFSPQAVISLGVNPNLKPSDGYVAESRAHNQGLKVKANGHIVHDDHAPMTASLTNYSLSRAIYEGGGQEAIARASKPDNGTRNV